MKILAIETSCDDTSIAILEDNIVLSIATFSQIKTHKNTGGVIPEIASRLHQEAIFSLIKKATFDANISLKEIDYIAFTGGPGLINALQVGLIVAKMLANLLKVPFYKINHLEAHLYSPFIGIDKKNIPQKSLALIVSGGHTILALKENNNLRILGETKDDAIGEAYDKVGKVLNLEYPAGPKIDQLLKQTTLKHPSDIKGPKINLDNYNFSYSGLKTWINMNKEKYSRVKLLNFFQEKAVEQLLTQVKKAQKEFKINNIFIAGGVSANSYLRSEAKNLLGINVYFPKQMYSTDNAAMIGYAFYVLKSVLKPEKLDSEVNPNWKLGVRNDLNK